MCYRRSVAILLILCLLLLPCSALATQSDSRPVTVGFEMGYGMIDNSDSVDSKGYGYDFLRQMSDYVTFDFSFEEYRVGESLLALENDEIDIVGPVFASEINTEKLNITTYPIGSALHALVAKNPNEYFYNNKQSFAGKSVMTYEGNPANEFFEEYLYVKGIEVEMLYGDKENYYEEPADLYLINSNNHYVSKDYTTVANLGSSDLYLATNKSNPLLLEALDIIISDVTTGQIDIISELYEKYYAGNKALTSRGLTVEEYNTLYGTVFNVGYIQDHEPFQYSDDEGNPKGVSIEMLNSLAQEYGFFVNYIPYDSKTVNVSNLETNVLLSSLGEPSQILQNHSITNAYASEKLYLMTRSSAEEETPSKIAMARYSGLSKQEVEEAYPNSIIEVYSNFEDAITSFETNRVDGLLFLNTGFATNKLSHITTDVQPTQLNVPFCMYISEELSDDYVGIFNTLFNLIPDSYFLQTVTEQSVIAMGDELTFDEFVSTYWPVFLIGVLILVLMGVAYSIYQHNLKEKAIVKALNFDELTGLPSVRRMDELTKRLISKADPETYELITLDIDYFRLINTLYGMELGEKVIKTIAGTLTSQYKGTDAHISRIYADQFCIVKKSSEGTPILQICEEHIVPSVLEIVGQSFSFSMSGGICKFKNPEDTLSLVLDRANVAKAKGKSRHELTCFYFDEQMQNEYENRLSVTYKMQKALDDGEFVMVYQPKVDLQTQKICGAEALVRWNPPQSAPVFPDTFIPIFEANGFINNLDMYVFDRVCAFVYSNSSKVRIPHISVNLSAITLVDEQLCEKLVDITGKYNVTPQDLEIELTESAMVKEVDMITKRISELKNAGFSVSIDDFGKGTSSLGKLSSIDIDILKLDKDFLEFSVDNKKGAIVVEDVIRMTKRLGIKVVSECIETAEQANWLKQLGCDMAQGYYFEKPLGPNEFVKVLIKDTLYPM